MKSLINFLILTLVVVGLGFGIWLAVDKSLFGDAEQQLPPQQETGIPAVVSKSVEAPTEISSEEAFSITASSDENASSNTDCSKAGEMIGVIYDMHHEGKSPEEISQYLAGLGKFTQEEVEVFTQIADSIKNAPSEQLLPREEMIKEFKLQCEAAE